MERNVISAKTITRVVKEARADTTIPEYSTTRLTVLQLYSMELQDKRMNFERRQDVDRSFRSRYPNRNELLGRVPTGEAQQGG